MAEQEKQDMASDDGVTFLEPEAFLVPDFPTFGFDVRPEKTDLVLFVKNYRLFAKKSHLQFNSPVFESMIEDNPGETLIIEDVKCADFAEFLACIQPRNRRKISRENVFRMVELAKKYEVEDLIERCEYCLIEMLRQETKPTGIKAITLFLDNAFKYDLETLKSECLKISAELDEASMCDKAVLEGMSSDARCHLYETWLPRLTTKAQLADLLMAPLTKREKESLVSFCETSKLFTITCKSISKKEPLMYSYDVFGIKWIVNIYFFSNRVHTAQYSIQKDRTKMTKQFKSKIAVSTVIQNHIPGKENMCSLRVLNFDSLEWWNTINLKICNEDISDPALGFKMDGQFSLQVKIIFNKPSFDE